MSPPIISPYKKVFTTKRVLQTFLGGPKLVASFWIVVSQAFLYLIPVIIILMVNVADSEILGWQLKAMLTGVGVFLVDITLTFIIWILKQRRDGNITPEHDRSTDSPVNSITSGALFDEEEMVPEDGCFKSSTWRFIAGNVNMSLCHFSALLASAISTLLCVSVLADESAHLVLKAFVAFTICNARYSSVINAPAEVATFDPVKRRHLFYRPFYVSLCASVNYAMLVSNSVKGRSSETLFNEEGEQLEKLVRVEGDESCCSTFFGILISTLPLIWLSGILPPLDALFPWLFETVLGFFGGKSVGYTYFGTTISLALALIGPLATFILSQERKITLLLECLCGYLISCDTGFMPKLKPSLCEDVPVKYFLQQLIKPAVTVVCSVLSVVIVETVLSNMTTVPSREVYHPIFASLSIFVLLTTKVVQWFDITHRKWAHSRVVLPIFTMWHGGLTLLLHIWLAVELVTEHLEENLTKSLDTFVHSLQQLLPCILSIRFFALSVTEPCTSTINITVAILYQTLCAKTTEKQMKFVYVLFIVSIAHDVLKRFVQHVRMVGIFIYATFSTRLMDRKYVAGAALLSAPISVISIILASFVKGMSLVPMFTLPIFTIGFPRPLSFWKGMWFLKSCGRNETQRILPIASSVDWTIYSDVAPFLVHAFAKRNEEAKTDLQPGACYIARYEDRLLFIRVLSSGWKFLYAQVKGLEIQEQTSCHHQEAAWMDEMFEKYLHNCNPCLKRLYTCPMSLVNSLVPKFCLNVPSYSESKSQLPNFLSQAGKLIFRDMFFRAFSFLWIQGNPAFQGESYRRPIASGVPISKHLNKMQAQAVFERTGTIRNGHHHFVGNHSTSADRNNIQLGSMGPDLNGNRAHSFIKDALAEGVTNSGLARGTSAPMMMPRQHPPLRNVSAAYWQGSMSYPLIPGLPNLAVEDSELESLPISLNQCTNENGDGKEITNGTISPPSGLTRRNSSWDGLPQLWMKQCVGDAIPHNAVKARAEKMCWKVWEFAFGTHDDLYEVDMARFYRREFAKNIRTTMFSEKTEFEDIAVRAFRYATKLTLDEVYAGGLDLDDSPTPISASRSRNDVSDTFNVTRSEEEEQGIFLQLCSFEKRFRFCPYDEVPYWMNEKAKHIVSICADGDKNILRIFNYQSDGVEFSVGELSKYCVEGIWSSLNTELLYLTSDDDERYSIQHDKYLLRNICAQSAQTLGYPVYEATFRVNLFDFSLEQVSI